MKITHAMLAAMAAAVTLLSGCGQVDSSEAGLKTWFGKVDSPVLDAGLYWVNPVGGKLYTYSTRDIRVDTDMAAYTKDMQSAQFGVSVIHAIDRSRLVELHTKYGRDYVNVILSPAVSAAVKEVAGQWEAESLVNRREEATQAIYERVSAAVKGSPLTVKSLVICNIDFSDAFEKALEDKVIQAQEAIRMKNKTVQVGEEAKQVEIRAQAEARAMTIRGEALRANKDLVILEAIQKWDGKAPATLAVGEAITKFLPLK